MQSSGVSGAWRGLWCRGVSRATVPGPPSLGDGARLSVSRPGAQSPRRLIVSLSGRDVMARRGRHGRCSQCTVEAQRDRYLGPSSQYTKSSWLFGSNSQEMNPTRSLLPVPPPDCNGVVNGVTVRSALALRAM